MTNDGPVYIVIDNGKMYTGLSLAICIELRNLLLGTISCYFDFDLSDLSLRL